MPKFEVEIPHRLSADEVCIRLERARAKLEQDYGATCVWPDARTLTVVRKGLSARVTIEETKVVVNVELAFLMAPMASSVRSGLQKRLTDLLA